MRVLKFGGSIFQSSDDFLKMAEIVRSHSQEPVLVVVSALSSATRDLEQCALIAQDGKAESALVTLQSILNEQYNIAASILEESAARESITALLEQCKIAISNLLRGIAITRELTPRTLDSVLSYGEFMALHIFRYFLLEQRLNVSSVEAINVVVSDKNHGSATPLRDKTLARVEQILRPAFNDSAIVLIQGFVARNENGDITTMGKESSNLTATLLAELLGAVEVKIFTNVEGIRTADPLVVHNSRSVRQLTYSQAYRLAVNGVKLLYPTMIEPVRRAEIPLVFSSLHAPNGEFTVISNKSASTQTPILTVREGVAVTRVVFHSAEAKAKSREVYSQIFTDAGRVVSVTEYPDAMCVVASGVSVSQVSSVIPENCSAYVTQGHTLITILNAPERAFNTFSASLLKELNDQGLVALDAGYEETTMRIVVPNAAGNTVAKLIHYALYS